MGASLSGVFGFAARLGRGLSPTFGAKVGIEAEIGHSLIWDAGPDSLDKTIANVRDVELANRKQWPEHIVWMVDMTEKFRKAFGPRVKKLNLEVEDEPGEDPQE